MVPPVAEHTSPVHGGLDLAELAELGIEPERVLDLSVNLNPFGPHPDVLRAIAGASPIAYPDRHDTRARAALARSLDEDPQRLLLGHGSAELLWTLIGTLPRERKLLVLDPTFSEPEAAAHAHGIPIARVALSGASGFAPELGSIAAAIEQHRPSAVYLCQPNNPTGRALPESDLRALLAAHPDCLFILDQAFLSLSERHAELRARWPDHVLVVRSLTKDHALAGLRIGYALGAPRLLARMRARRPPWMASSLAQAALEAAVQRPEHVRAAREFLLASRRELAGAVAALGFEVVPSETSFFMFRVSDAGALRARLLSRHGILVRDCASFGLRAFVRVAAGLPEHNARLCAALASEASP